MIASLTLGSLRLGLITHKDTPKLSIYAGGAFTAPVLIGMPGQHKELGAFLVEVGKKMLAFKPENRFREMMRATFELMEKRTGQRTGAKFTAHEKGLLRVMLQEGRFKVFAHTLVWNCIPLNPEDERATLEREIINVISEIHSEGRDA